MTDLKTPNTTQAFTITRVFDAPRERVFQAWTETERLAQWWGPKGFKLVVANLDLRPGGVFLYSMMMGDHQMWGRFIYQEIVAPERLVFTNSFSDATGKITRAPFSDIWPLEILNELTLTEQDGKTTLSLQGTPLNPTEAERQTYEAGFDSMRQGFGGTFDQLDAYLAQG